VLEEFYSEENGSVGNGNPSGNRSSSLQGKLDQKAGSEQ